jgi:hypothetical protein
MLINLILTIGLSNYSVDSDYGDVLYTVFYYYFLKMTFDLLARRYCIKRKFYHIKNVCRWCLN